MAFNDYILAPHTAACIADEMNCNHSQSITEQVAADLDSARQLGRLRAETRVRPFNGGAIVNVTEHPTESQATWHRVGDVRGTLASYGWATRPAGTQVIVEGRSATARQRDTLARTGDDYAEPTATAWLTTRDK